MSARKVLFVELNEINWTVIDQLTTERGTAYLPNFDKLRREGTWGTPAALEQPPHLDPWVTWVTVHRLNRADIIEACRAVSSALRQGTQS